MDPRAHPYRTPAEGPEPRRRGARVDAVVWACAAAAAIARLRGLVAARDFGAEAALVVAFVALCAYMTVGAARERS